MNPLIKTSLLLITFLACMAISLYGVVLPSNPQAAAVGAMQIAPYADGLSLFQDYRQLYYRFSPFNDYFIDRNGNRSSFISVPEIQNKAYSTSLEQWKWEKIAATIDAHLTGGQPSITFSTDLLKSTYRAKHQENILTVTRTITAPQTISVQKVGSTLSYNGDDLVFDSAQNVYNFWNQEDLGAFTNRYGISLTSRNEQLRVPIPQKEIFIMNPRAAFLIVVRAKPHQTMHINRDARLIEIEENVPAGQAYTTSIETEILQDPREVL